MKILGIGMPRTGTTSLWRALCLLGYKSVHLPQEPISALHKYDAGCDVTITMVYKELDLRFPGSKFILTVRDMPAWLASMEWLLNAQDRGEKAPAGWVARRTHLAMRIRREFYKREDFETEHFRRLHLAHLEDVREYFKDRPGDLLTMDICAGDGWEKLCPFLGKPVPDESFPNLNPGGHRCSS